jgi:hypothetical protein
MATKKTKPKPAVKAKPVITSVARPQPGDDLLDEDMLVDASGTFRAVSSIQQAQVGTADEDSTRRFASESLVMQAQRDGFREDGQSVVETAEETATDDEAAVAIKRQRLATLAARSEARAKKSRR